MDDYVKLLKKNNLKVTPQRLEVIRFLANNKTHPTANQIYTALKKKNPSLSKTTIYNSLDTLIKNRIINELTIIRSESMYDFGNDMHHHLLCRKCGNIIDIDVQCPHLEKMLKGKHKIEEVHGYFKGICEDCLSKEKRLIRRRNDG